jgi:hypothetical protein
MADLFAFVRLDMMTIKPYMSWKNCLLLMAAGALLAYGGSPTVTISMLMAVAAIYATYPFAVGEKSNMDVLYATLSIGRQTVVLGRYVFALSLTICTGAFVFVLSVLVAGIKGEAVFDSGALEALFVAFMMFVVCGIVQAIQLPVFFKWGYTKARTASLLSLGILAASAGAALGINDGDARKLFPLLDALESMPGAAIGIILIGFIALLAISYGLSMAFYKKREF